MSQYDRHLTTEQLSALLDRQVSAQEQVWQDAHLQICEQCQHQLADLRQTVGLLRALPQPPLPRSFLLPTSEEIASPSVANNNPVVLFHRSARRRPWPHGVRVAIRAVGTLAAVVGIVFLLSGLLGMVPHGGAAASLPVTSSFHAQSDANTPTKHFAITPSTSPDLTPTASPSPTITALQTQGLSRGPTPHNPSQAPSPNLLIPTLLFIDLNTAGGRVELGLLLLTLSMVGFLLLKYQSKHS